MWEWLKTALKAKSLLSITLIVFLSYIYLSWSYTANSDLTDGRHVLFMDEQITFDGVKKITSSQSPSELATAVIGKDQRYGRSTWYLPAFFIQLLGLDETDKSFIISYRMFHSIVMLLAFTLLIVFFLKNPLIQIVTLTTFLTLPFTSYYAHMPKPEAIQLLALTGFLITFFHYKKHLLSFSLFGFAIGSKVSALPFFCFLILTLYLTNKDWIKTNKYKVISLTGFGWLLNVPIILTGPSGIKEYLWWIKSNMKHGS